MDSEDIKAGYLKLSPYRTNRPRSEAEETAKILKELSLEEIDTLVKEHLSKLDVNVEKQREAQERRTREQGQLNEFLSNQFNKFSETKPKKPRIEHKAFIETRGRKPKYTTSLLKSLRSTQKSLLVKRDASSLKEAHSK